MNENTPTNNTPSSAPAAEETSRPEATASDPNTEETTTGATASAPAPKKKKLSFSERLKAVKTTRWIRFAIVSLIFLAWVVWMQRWWLAIFEVLLFDIYITGYIPFTWWKNSPNKLTRSVMSWVDAIVYALILVYFVFAFVGQNYQIPSSSLEKTLLTGDYLWVNKMVYGPRVPMTPVHFPLVHNKLLGMKSYLDSPANSYRRLKGLRKVEEGDIVVFNFPAGDTVAAKYEETPLYYDMLVEQYGRDYIKANPEMFGEIIYRPVDRRQNFVKRAVGLPGQNFRIENDTIYIDGEARTFPENVQFNYIFTTSRPIEDADLKELDITATDVYAYPPGSTSRMNLIPFIGGGDTYAYMAPLTALMISRMTDSGLMIKSVKFNEIATYFPDLNLTGAIFPYGKDGDWTVSNFGGLTGILIPAKGTTVALDEDSWTLYKRCIRNYEGHPEAYFNEAEGRAYIDGAPADTYTFTMDYYFMVGDNRDNSQDSRYWGFVPEDHIVGTPIIVLASIDPTRSLFDGGIRFNRFLKDANPDK
ncbi:MAG: signal peptidase I [Muribaculaceae bacterium]|nr:signal peptidase I [Muribaculaceae bacterium]